MPNRIIRESCRTSPSLDKLSAEAERLFWRLTTVADDFGRFESDPRILLAQCFPLGVERFKASQVREWYRELETCELVKTYASTGKQYGYFITWDKYQARRAKNPKYPSPDNLCDLMLTPANICEQAQANVSEESRNREARNEESRNTATAKPESGAGAGSENLELQGGNGTGKRHRKSESGGQAAFFDEAWEKAPWPSARRFAWLYNRHAPEAFARIRLLDASRLASIGKRVKELPEEAAWVKIFTAIGTQAFLTGDKTDSLKDHNRDVDWLLQDGKDHSANYRKVFERKFA